MIAAFSLVGFVFVKAVFAVVCWGIGHDSFEAIAGIVSSIGLGGWIGIEAYLSFTSWRSHKKCLNSTQADKIALNFFA